MTDLKLRVVWEGIDRATKPLKAILAGNRALAQSFQVTRARLQTLNRAQQDMTAFRTLHRGWRTTANALHTAQQRVQALACQLQATDTPTQTLTRTFHQAVRAARQLKQQHQQQTTQLHALRGQLAATGLQTGRLGEHERRLRGEITATNTALSTQQHQLTTLAQREKRLATARERLHATQGHAAKLAVAGYATRATGGRALTALAHPTHEASHTQTEIQRLRALGLGDAASSDAIQFAQSMKTIGTSTTENLTLMRDAMTVFADVPHAKRVAPILAKMKFANEALYGGEQAAANEQYLMSMLKVIELRGGLAPGQFRPEANKVQQVLSATGGRVGPEEWRQVIQTGGVAVKQMRRAAFYDQLEPLIQEMGGQAVGTGLMSAYSNIYQGNTTVRAAKELQRLGLLDPHKVEYNAIGMLKRFKTGALQGGDRFKQSPLEWLETVLLPALAKKGITAPDQIQDTLATIFTNRTAANVMTTMFLQRAQIHKSERLNARADDIDALVARAQRTPRGQEIAALAKLRDLERDVGEQVLPFYCRALQVAAQATAHFTRWLQRHTQATKVLISVFAGLAAVLTVAGTLTIALAATLGPLAVLKFSLTVLGLRGIGLMRGLRGVGQTLLWLGRLALAHPLIAFIAALAAGAVFVWQHWAGLGPKFADLWGRIKQDAAAMGVWLQAQWNRLYAGLDRLKQRLIGYGAGLIQGLVTGITQALHTVKQAILGAGERLMRWFPSPFEAHPRARVLLGMNLPRVKETPPAPPRWETRRPLTPPATRPVQIPGDTVQITIHAAPGMTPQALAQAIRAELDQRDRDKRARGASRFTDD